MIRTRANAINHLINKHRMQDVIYLEIGVFGGLTLKDVNAKIKDGVDTENYCECHAVNYKMTSDDFFKDYIDKKYDVIFIDGLHTAIQVSKDLKNSLLHLNKDNGGLILFDDVYPHNEFEQKALDLSNKGANTGDCWKAVKYYFDALREISDDVVFYPNIDRGMIGFKIKPGIHHIDIDFTMPTKNNGIGNEWYKYTYDMDYKNFFDEMMKYAVKE